MPKPEDCKGRTGHSQGCKWYPSHRTGTCTVPVLKFLKGKPWDANTFAWMHSLRPSWIRVIQHGDGIQLDSMLWRVTVYLRDDETIHHIEQTVTVGLPDNAANGYDLMNKTGLNDNQDRIGVNTQAGESNAQS